MTSRRDALVGRFRVHARTKLQRASLALIEVAEARADERVFRELLRDLHTLKGDSHMLGFTEMARVMHAAEDLLQGESSRAEAGRRIQAALAAVLAALDADASEVVCSRIAGDLAGAGAPPAAAAAAVDRAEPAPEHASEERWAEVNMARIDELCGLVAGFASEFRTAFAHVESFLKQLGSEDRSIGSAVREDLDRLRVGMEEITSAAWALRLVPIEPVFNELSRHAHELASALDKRVRVEVRGGRSELERNVLDALRDPLLHLVRNAIDHGVEREGNLIFDAEAQGPSMLLTIMDDGRGIDVDDLRAAAVARGILTRESADALSDGEALDLIFRPGFSTRQKVTELSGRGMGLDVVRQVVDGLGGAVGIHSSPGKGTRIVLTVPVRISKDRQLVFFSGDGLYSIPARQIREIIRSSREVAGAAGGPTVESRGEVVPLRSMSAALGRAAAEELDVLIIESGNLSWAFSVERVIAEYELVRQPVDDVVGAGGLISAAGILDDGRLVLILSVAALGRRLDGRVAEAILAHEATKVLAVDDSPLIRELVARVLGESGFDVRVAVDGRAALEIMQSFSPDLVVADVEMPNMNGLELLQHIRAERRSIPVIMLSNRGAPEDVRTASELGADAYLLKSDFKPATLLDTVRSVRGVVR